MLALLALTGALGCQAQAVAPPRAVPEPAVGRAAMTTALNEWQRGGAPGKIDTVRPAVVLVDNHRKPGQRLERFEILGQVEGDHTRTFTVRVVLANPPEEPLLRFHVFGREPLWVFRQEDYDMLSHWDCPPPASPAPQATAQADASPAHEHVE